MWWLRQAQQPSLLGLTCPPVLSSIDTQASRDGHPPSSAPHSSTALPAWLQPSTCPDQLVQPAQQSSDALHLLLPGQAAVALACAGESLQSDGQYLPLQSHDGSPGWQQGDLLPLPELFCKAPTGRCHMDWPVQCSGTLPVPEAAAHLQRCLIVLQVELHHGTIPVQICQVSSTGQGSLVGFEGLLQPGAAPAPLGLHGSKVVRQEGCAKQICRRRATPCFDTSRS